MISWVFFPFEFIFYILVRIRHFLYDSGFLKTISFSRPVVVVGNLSAGGTGKTPHVFWLAQQLKKQKKKVVIVSRGYGGHYGGYATRVDASLENAAAVFGDEPVFYQRHLEVPVYVAHDRSSAVAMALQEHSPDVILSDDGFQHRRLGRNTDIVLIDSTNTNTALFPRGRFREPLSSLKRAHFVILTKVNLATHEQKEKWLLHLAKYGFSLAQQNLFLSEMHISQIEILRGVGELKNRDEVFLASSIASPKTFYQMLENSLTIKKHFEFPDHFLWTQKDVDRLEAEALKQGVKNIVVTEKDAVKLDPLVFRYVQVYVAHLGLKVTPAFPTETLL